MITTQILIKNDEDRIEKTLESILQIESSIIVADLGSTDNTIDICKKYDCKIVSANGNRSEVRNKLLIMSKTDWQFYIEPGEVLSSGHEFMGFLEGKAKRLYVVYDDIINKEVRIFNKNYKFVNPVYETLTPDDSEPINIFISSSIQSNYLQELLLWKKEMPHLAEVDYYLACQYLMLNKHTNFLCHAQYFLFQDTKSLYQTIMMRYYLAQVLLTTNTIRTNIEEATRNIVYCLSQKPLMAEFWCLLGDCYNKIGMKSHAAEFFKMAIEMGKSRQTDDSYPIEFAKYQDYPSSVFHNASSTQPHNLA